MNRKIAFPKEVFLVEYDADFDYYRTEEQVMRALSTKVKQNVGVYRLVSIRQVKKTVSKPVVKILKERKFDANH